MMKSYNG